MRAANFAIFTAGSMTGNLSSTPIKLEHRTVFAAQLVWTGTPTGTLTLQGSNDLGDESAGTGPAGVTGLTNWTTISTQAVSGAAGDHIFNSATAGYRWARVTYTASSSTGSLSGRVQTKGV